MATGVKRQLSMVMDLNKCIGCHTCTSPCKMQWTNRNGREHMYWNNVETQPGRGYPRDYAPMGGGVGEAGNLRIGREPSAEGYGIPWEYNFEESLMTGLGPRCCSSTRGSTAISASRCAATARTTSCPITSAASSRRWPGSESSKRAPAGRQGPPRGSSVHRPTSSTSC